MKRKIYVASSWRNLIQPAIVTILKSIGHEVYDFRHPANNDDWFHWTEIDPNWQSWTPEEFKQALEHPVAESGFKKDMDALDRSDACVLVMPCGRSAHLELGYAIGKRQKTVILLEAGEPELMYKMVDHIITSPNELFDIFGEPDSANLFEAKLKGEAPWHDDDLLYSATSRCPCGAGLAYPKGIRDPFHYWDCADILTRRSVAGDGKKHTDQLPFNMWKVKSEGQGSAYGATTRPTPNPEPEMDESIPVTHALQTAPEPWMAARNGSKRFEFRRNDRGFKVGDSLELHCLAGLTFLLVRITYIAYAPQWFIPDGFCCMSIELEQIVKKPTETKQ